MKKIIYILAITFFAIQINAQNVEFDKKLFKNDKDGFKLAEDNLKSGNELYEQGLRGSYKMALEYFLKANNFNPSNAKLNYKIGVCYVKSVSQEKSLNYLLKAEKLNPFVAGDINYMLGRAYHYNLKFDDAIKEYNKYKNRLAPQELTDQRKIIEKRVTECETGKKLVAEPVRVFIDNAGENINSSYPDYSPLVTADGSMMIFTSRREGTTGDGRSLQDNQYFEDIWYSYYMDGKWEKAQNIGKPLNTKDNDATVGLSPDGQKLFTYLGKSNGGDILESELNGAEWEAPSDNSLKKYVNTDYHESAASFSFDGRAMYYATSKPENSFGMHDLYISYYDDEKERWGEPTNLGSVINTEYDERSVFMAPDGRTIYFSSTGHETMGDFDIFMSTMDDEGNWSKPENMGYPINTPGDDRFFVSEASGKKGYYASDKTGGYGEHDIYIITFLGPEKPMIASIEDNLIGSLANPIKEAVIQESVAVKTMRLTILKGTIKDALTNEPVAAEIEVVDNEKNQVISVIKSNSATGAYLVSLPSGKNYGIAVKSEGYLFHSENFNIPSTSNYQEITKDILLNKMVVGSKIVLENIFFDYAKATLRSESYPELDRLVELLNKFPTVRIEISGHTDNKGSLTTNKRLSKARAESVVNFLIKKGIPASRLEFEGYAYLQPISDNNTAEGRQKNRRVEFKVLSN
jgi:outer membrane protein OmpA-like peptidoglycan-associated protein